MKRSLLIGMACSLFISACGLGQVFGPTVPATPTNVVASTLTPAPTFTPIPISDSTQVIVFHPPGMPIREHTGSCWSTSNLLIRDDAWRCMLNNRIYDPCFSISGTSLAVICDTSPLSDNTGFKLNLTEPLPARGTEPLIKYAWAFELDDGTDCTFMGGATAAFEGERVNYSCSDGWVILGELQQGQVWTARKVRLSSDLSSIEESVQASIKIVWF